MDFYASEWSISTELIIIIKGAFEVGKDSPTLELIDSHCHLEEIENLGPAIEKAKSTGVVAIIAVGSDYESNNRTLEIAEKYNGFVHPALGLHPGRLETSQIDRSLKFIEDHLTEVRGIGEIGLDYDKRIIKIAPKELQKSVLREVLIIAKKYEKPVVIHSRYAWGDSLALVEDAEIQKALFHWYTGPSSILKDIVRQDYFVSATPAAEYHQEHRRAVKATALENLLIETDSPVSYGTELRWRAEPADVIRTLKAVALVRGTDEQELAQITTNNAIRFFDLPLIFRGGGKNGRQTLYKT